jgi:cytochrome b involved in lipid metabolism
VLRARLKPKKVAKSFYFSNYEATMSETVYTWEEIVKHNTTKDLWIVYKDMVYDVTKFLEEHPGGEEIILDVAGDDSTTRRAWVYFSA